MRGAPARANPVTWHRHVVTDGEVAVLRADARRNALSVAWVLALQARADGTTAPTWQGLMEATGLSRSSVARWLRYMHRIGLIETLVHGSTEQYRRASLLEGNLAAVYQLIVPGTDTPTGTSRSEVPLRAREEVEQVGGVASSDQEGQFGRFAVPRTRRERRAAAETFRATSPALRRGRPRAVAHVLDPFLRAGWTVSDLSWAVDVRPDGTRWTYTTEVKCPHRWLAHRLKSWQGLEPPVALARAAHERHLEASRSFFADHDTAARQAVPAPSWFTAMRQQLVRRVGRAR